MACIVSRTDGPRLRKIDPLAIDPAGQMRRHGHVCGHGDDALAHRQAAEGAEDTSERLLGRRLVRVALLERLGDRRRRRRGRGRSEQTWQGANQRGLRALRGEARPFVPGRHRQPVRSSSIWPVLSGAVWLRGSAASGVPHPLIVWARMTVALSLSTRDVEGIEDEPEIVASDIRDQARELVVGERREEPVQRAVGFAPTRGDQNFFARRSPARAGAGGSRRGSTRSSERAAGRRRRARRGHAGVRPIGARPRSSRWPETGRRSAEGGNRGRCGRGSADSRPRSTGRCRDGVPPLRRGPPTRCPRRARRRPPSPPLARDAPRRRDRPGSVRESAERREDGAEPHRPGGELDDLRVFPPARIGLESSEAAERLEIVDGETAAEVLDRVEGRRRVRLHGHGVTGPRARK